LGYKKNNIAFSKNKTENQERLSTLERAIKILEYLESYQEEIRLSTIFTFFKISFGTSFNILRTLEEYKLIERRSLQNNINLVLSFFE